MPRSSDGDGPAALPHAAILRPHDHARREHGQQDHAEPQRRTLDPGLEQDVDQDRHIDREHDDVGMRQVRPGDRADRLVEPGPGQRDQPGGDRRAGPGPRARGDHQDRGGNHEVVPVHALVDHHAEHPHGRERVVLPAVGDDPDAVEEVGPVAAEPDGQEAQDGQRGGHRRPSGRGQGRLAGRPARPRSVIAPGDAEGQRRGEQDDLRADDEGGGRAECRGDPAAAGRPAVGDHQPQHHEERAVPVLLDHIAVIQAQVVAQERRVADRPRQEPAEPPPAPEQHGRAEGDHEGRVRREDRRRAAPAEDLADGPEQVDRAGEVVLAEVAIRAQPGIPAEGQRGEDVVIHEERPGEQVGDPGRELERAQADDEGGERAPEHPRCNPVGQFGSPLRDAKREIRGAPCGRPIAAASPRRGQGPGAPPWPDSRPGIDGGSYPIGAPGCKRDARGGPGATPRPMRRRIPGSLDRRGDPRHSGDRRLRRVPARSRRSSRPRAGGRIRPSSRCSGRVPSRMRSASSGLPTTFSFVPWVICLRAIPSTRSASTRLPRGRTFT